LSKVSPKEGLKEKKMFRLILVLVIVSGCAKGASAQSAGLMFLPCPDTGQETQEGVQQFQVSQGRPPTSVEFKKIREGHYFKQIKCAFDNLILEVKPRIISTLSEQDKAIAERVDFIVDESDFGGVPISDINDANQRGLVKFPIGFILSLDTLNRAFAEANFCNPRLNVNYNRQYCDDSKAALQNKFPIWVLIFQEKVKRAVANALLVGKDRRASRLYLNLATTSPFCETYSVYPQNCIQIRENYDSYFSDITHAAFIMVMAHELSHQLLPNHIRSEKPIVEREREADRKGAEIFLRDRQIPLYAMNAFAMLASVEAAAAAANIREESTTGARSYRRSKENDYPDANCRAIIVLDILMTASAKEKGWIDHFQERGRLVQAQNYVNIIHAAAQKCPIPPHLAARLLSGQ
jgi:hypothetical protein